MIENVHWQAPVRIEARKDFDPGLMWNLLNEENEYHIQRRRDLQSSIEAILADSPGIFSYRNKDNEPVRFEEAKSIILEYRLYPDGLSQHELINGIVGIANALLYIDRREELLRDEITDQV